MNKQPPTLQCAIEDASVLYPYFFLEPHIAACVAVMRRYTSSPALFQVDCDQIISPRLDDSTSFRLEVSWSKESVEKAQRLLLTIHEKTLVEMAAVALGLMLARRVAELGQLDVTRCGERADYRLLDVPVVLEISGTEVMSEFGRRHREKVTQALSNPLGWDAYVVVCGFGPSGHRIRFSYHRKEETADA